LAGTEERERPRSDHGYSNKRAEPVTLQRELEGQLEAGIIVGMDKTWRGVWSRELNTSLRKGDLPLSPACSSPRLGLGFNHLIRELFRQRGRDG